MTESTAPTRPFLPPRRVIRLAWWIHRSLFRFTGGRLGLRRPDSKRYGLMSVTTTGRQTGQERNVMLAYIEDGPDLVTLAMNGWAQNEPAWWLNMQAHPEVKVQLIDELHHATGRVATSDERDRLWQRWSELDEKLDAYAGLRPTETAVVILTPLPDS